MLLPPCLASNPLIPIELNMVPIGASLRVLPNLSVAGESEKVLMSSRLYMQSGKGYGTRVCLVAGPLRAKDPSLRSGNGEMWPGKPESKGGRFIWELFLGSWF